MGNLSLLDVQKISCLNCGQLDIVCIKNVIDENVSHDYLYNLCLCKLVRLALVSQKMEKKIPHENVK